MDRGTVESFSGGVDQRVLGEVRPQNYSKRIARPSREMCTYGECFCVSTCERRDGVVFSWRLFPLRGCKWPAGSQGSYRGFVLKIASVSRASAALITRFYPRRRRAVSAHRGWQEISRCALSQVSLTALLRSVRTSDSLCANESRHPLTATHHSWSRKNTFT